MKRRDAIKGFALVGVGAGGYAFWERNESPASIVSGMSDAVGPPKTESRIDSVGWSSEIFDQMVLYESGAAKIHFNYNHEIEKFSITHGSLSTLESPFNVFQAPDFEGPKVIDLKTLLENNGPYPSNEFKLGVYFEEAENLSLAGDVGFQAPRDWIDISGLEPVDT